MNARWHRAAAGLGLALAGVLLTGCHAQGTFDVLSEERVAVDLTITGTDLNCPHGADALKLTVTTTIDEYGDEVCHVTGETQATYFSPFGLTISPAAEYLVLQLNLSGGLDSWPSADIDVRFPGKVMDSSRGVVSDNVVRITDLGELTQGSGLHVVGLKSAGPPQWLVAALAGAGAGVVLTLVVGFVVVLARRPRPDPLAPLDDAFPLPDTGAQSTVPARHPILSPADPPAPSAQGPAPPPEDTSWFATPPPSTESVNGKLLDGARSDEESRASGSPAAQHSAWARPAEASRDKQAG